MKVTSDFISTKYNIKRKYVEKSLKQAAVALRPIRKDVKVTGTSGKSNFRVIREGVGSLVTKFGDFYQYEFSVNDRWKRYSVIFAGDVDGSLMPVLKKRKSVLLRLDSGCETSQVTQDLTCDCRDQLLKSMANIAKRKNGFIIRMPLQEGKGRGLYHKLAAHLLENQLGISNVESAMLLSGNNQIDVRTYDGALAILKFFGLENGTTLEMLTNNPSKLVGFYENGYKVKRVPLKIKPNKITSIHLKAKQEYLGHLNLV